MEKETSQLIILNSLSSSRISYQQQTLWHRSGNNDDGIFRHYSSSTLGQRENKNYETWILEKKRNKWKIVGNRQPNVNETNLKFLKKTDEGKKNMKGRRRWWWTKSVEMEPKVNKRQEKRMERSSEELGLLVCRIN